MSMGRLTGEKYWDAYEIVALRDGERCRKCHKTPEETRIILEHIDATSHNNYPENLTLLCDSCNNLLRGKSAKYKAKVFAEADIIPYSALCVCVNKEKSYRTLTGTKRQEISLGNIQSSGELIINSIAERRFRLWLLERLFIYSELSYQECLDAGAEYCGINQETVKKYIAKMTSRWYGTLDIVNMSGVKALRRRPQPPKANPYQLKRHYNTQTHKTTKQPNKRPSITALITEEMGKRDNISVCAAEECYKSQSKKKDLKELTSIIGDGLYNGKYSRPVNYHDCDKIEAANA